MDNSEVVGRWGPPVLIVVVGWLGTAAALWWLVAGPHDPGSRLFSGISVVVLALCTLYGTRARPRLALTSTGIEVRGLGGAQHYDWAHVDDVRLLHTPGLGRRTLTLEISVHSAGTGADGAGNRGFGGRGTGDGEDVERLLIFSRLDLGADPRDVIDVLTAARPTS